VNLALSVGDVALGAQQGRKPAPGTLGFGVGNGAWIAAVAKAVSASVGTDEQRVCQI